MTMPMLDSGGEHLNKLLADAGETAFRMGRSIFHFLIPLAVIINSCKGGAQERKSGTAEIPEVGAPGLLFNGTNLEGWEISNFGPQGAVNVSGESIILGMGDGCTGITWKKDFPEEDYEVTLQAKRIEGTDFFCGITFPVGKSPCTLVVGGWGGSVVGLSSINGMDASENETKTLRKFEKDHWYAIRLRVEGDKISAWIDDEMVVDFAIGNKVLSIRPEVELSKPFGIATFMTTAALRDIRVQEAE